MKIAIDAGHGFNTPGKRSPDGTMREWSFNSDVATRVCELLKKYGINTLRTDDIMGKNDIGLSDRSQMIRAEKCDLSVSIHANAGGGTGIETFAYKPGTNADKLANLVQAHLIRKTGMRDRGVKYSGFHMVVYPPCPAILCELGFMDNASDLGKLKSDDYRFYCATAIVAGILEYLRIENKEDEMTNEQFAKMMDHYLYERGLKPRLYNEHIKQGITDGTRPQSWATREEVAMMISRI
ncbi:MAG: N-acetylmuramoyl-L-alanine amidase [Oscillospiraceae bacterium]|nr:N-acetylmuramoyl-L-alanine amidase [Oscillospiraceae bacterium]